MPALTDAAESGRDVLTDMDVLALDIDGRLRLSRSILECKSGAGQAKEPYTLVWLAGFRQLMRFDRAVLVRSTVSRRGRALAARLHISIIEEKTLAAREMAHAWVPERFAHIDGAECVAAERRTDLQLKGLPGVPTEVVSFLRCDALLASPAALVAGVESLGRAVEAQGILPEPANRILGGHALSALVLAAVQDAAALDAVPPSELAMRLARALTIGDPDDSSLVQLLEQSDALVRHVHERTHRAYVDAGAEPIQVEMPSLREVLTAPPNFVGDYVDLVDRFRSNPSVARELLQTVELTCFEALLGGPAWSAESFAHLFTSEHRALMMAAHACLYKVAGPHVGDSLAELGRIPFTGSGGRVPDRRASTASSDRQDDETLPGLTGEGANS